MNTDGAILTEGRKRGWGEGKIESCDRATIVAYHFHSPSSGENTTAKLVVSDNIAVGHDVIREYFNVLESDIRRKLPDAVRCQEPTLGGNNERCDRFDCGGG